MLSALQSLNITVTNKQQVFKNATLYFSCDRTLNLTKIIPAMDYLNSILATNALDDDLPFSIKAALTIGKKILNQYYSKTDYSDMYHIAIGSFSLFFFILLFLVTD